MQFVECQKRLNLSQTKQTTCAAGAWQEFNREFVEIRPQEIADQLILKFNLISASLYRSFDYFNF